MRPVAAVLLAALLSVPAAAPAVGVSRYRLEIWQVPMSAAHEPAPFTAGPGGREADMSGWEGTVRGDAAALADLAGREGARVLYRGEAETEGTVPAVISLARTFPVETVDQRGDQRTVVTRMEQVGAQLSVQAAGEAGDARMLTLEFSAVEGYRDGRSPVLYRVSSKGQVLLPDGGVAVFSFTDRVDAAMLGADEDRVFRYVVLVAREDAR